MNSIQIKKIQNVSYVDDMEIIFKEKSWDEVTYFAGNGVSE